MSEINPQETPFSESEQVTPDQPVEEAREPLRLADLLRRWGFLVLVGGAVLALDQFAKKLVTERLALGQSWEPIPQIGSLIRITRSYNTGAAFGLLPQASDIFLLLALVTIVVFVVSYPKLPSRAWLSRLSISLISGGALSNAIDRLRLGRVTDYVHVQLTPTLSNISNFADHAITLGVILLLVDQWLGDRHQATETAGTDVSTLESEEALGLSEEIAAPLESLPAQPAGQIPVDNAHVER